MTPIAPAPEQARPAGGGGGQPPPIVVLIHRDKAGNWTIEPEDKQSNSQRFSNHEDSADGASNTFYGRWSSRYGMKRREPHDPIFFLEGDVFQFECKEGLPFGIGATKNPDVEALPGAPDDPFESESWKGGERGRDGTRISRDGRPLTATVRRSDGETPGVKAQRFYKFHGWVRVDGEFKPVDPDGYCGG
jgi:hypothetical protein